MGVPQAVDQMKNDPAVKFAQPNYRYYALSSPCTLPTDQYDNLYGTTESWPFLKIQMDKAVTLFNGWPACPPGSSSVTLAVLDSGISRNHPDLRNTPLNGFNAIGASGGADPVCPYSAPFTDSAGVTASMDDFGHGTYVAGIIAASWNSSNSESAILTCNNGFKTGVAGVAPGITLLAVKVLDCTGSGTTSSIVLGTNYAVSHGARVLNFSLGSSASSGLDPMEQQALDNALANNCVIVASSGNESSGGKLAPVDFPAAYPPVIAVGATDENDNVADYSNGGANLDLVAPGGSADPFTGNAVNDSANKIFSSFLCPLPAAAISENAFETDLDHNFGVAAGTSAAAPFVSGAAALVMSVYPNLTNTQVSQAIINNADFLAGQQGWDSARGYGRLNIYKALLNANGPLGASQLSNYVKTFNSPNPFHPDVDGTTNITLAITQAQPVELTIFDTGGEVVFHKNYAIADLNNNSFNPQYKSFYVPWDGKNGSGQKAKTGIYFYVVNVGGQIGRNKIALIQGSK
ncbi:MAG TPA: S8 family serine peptidase, partial [bacterium]